MGILRLCLTAALVTWLVLSVWENRSLRAERDAAEMKAAMAEASAERLAHGWRVCEVELDRKDSLR